VSASLSAALLAGTADARRQLGRSPFLAALLEGAWGGGVYGEYARALQCVHYLRCLREVYRALEAALGRHRAHPVVRCIPRTQLLAPEAIERDLWRLAGDDWQELAPTACAAALHAERLGLLADEAPALLVAHAYAATVCESLTAGLPGAWVTRTFRCPLDPRERCPRVTGGSCPVTRRWAEHLDELPLAPAEAAELVQEARLAFRLREQLCAELAWQGEDA
jgi:heme oxygenase (biliverdin-producing, ferredoxin)